MYVIIVLILFLIFFAVYAHYLKKYNNRRNEEGYRQVKEAFKRITVKNWLSVTAVDRFNNRLIAIDPVLGKLVLIEYKEGITRDKCFDLDEVMFCRIIKTNKKIRREVQGIEMELIFRNNESVSFSFYDETRDGRAKLSRRLKKAEHWKRMVQTQLSTRKIVYFSSLFLMSSFCTISSVNGSLYIP